jgi:predicted PurR-regulated permease PerM
MASQDLDLVTPLKHLLPQLFETQVVSDGITTALYSFITKITNSIMNAFSDLILNFPTLLLQFLVVLFVFFFSLRDGESLVEYIKSLLPFSKETEKRLFKSTNDITYSVLYGQVILGILQGLVVGVGLFIFGVHNALFLTLLACIAGILPIIGTAIVWIPVVISLLISNNLGAFFGVLVFGLASTIFESIIKPAFVAKRTNVNSVVILVGMIGGIFFLGTLGAIIGPLILAYLLIILDLYRDKKIPGAIIEPEKS